MIELVSGRMDKNLFNPHVLMTKCCLYSALINFGNSFINQNCYLSDWTGYHAWICRDNPGGHFRIYFSQIWESSGLVFFNLTRNNGGSCLVRGCLGQGMAPSIEENPDQLIMNSQSPCRKGHWHIELHCHICCD